MPDPHQLESTAILLERHRSGDPEAAAVLLGRYLPLLRAWAHGRLPARARGMAETDDLVQTAMIGTFRNLGAFQYRHEGAFLAYLKQGVLNALRNEIRRSGRHPTDEELTESAGADDMSASRVVATRQLLDRYEASLETLTEDQRHAVVLRLEFGLSLAEIARALGRPSADAARMLVARGLMNLAESLGEASDYG
jgi:RNA polymerase sigma-70 factor (ECF subfamily)